MTSGTIRNFLDMYRAITSENGLELCKSPPLEIVLTLLASDHMVMKDEEIYAAVDAPRDNIRRWMKVLVERGILVETEMDSGKLYSITPGCLDGYVVEI